MSRFDDIDDSLLTDDEWDIKYPGIVIPGQNYVNKEINEDLEIRVYNDDGMQPRFHIVNKDESLHVIIDIFEAKYESDQHLTNEQIDSMINWFNLEFDLIGSEKSNNWEMIKDFWYGIGNYMNNWNYQFTIPNYNNLKGEN